MWQFSGEAQDRYTYRLGCSQVRLFSGVPTGEAVLRYTSGENVLR